MSVESLHSLEPTLAKAQTDATNYIGLGLGLGLIALQLAGLFLLGSQPFPLLCLAVIDIGSLLLVLHYGLANCNALMIVIALAFHLTIAALIKLLIGQPLEENLLVPDTTFAIELVYFLALLAAFYTTKSVKIPSLLPNKPLDPELLRNIAIGTTALSVVVTLVYIGQNAEIGQQYGEVNSASSSPLTVAVRGFGTLGLVCCAARAVLLSNRAKLIDPLSFVILALSVAVGISSNSREGVAAPIVAFVTTGLAFGYRLRVKTIVMGAAFMFVFVNYVSPALVLTRGERDTLGPLERAVYALEAMGDLLLDTPRGQEYRGLLVLNEDIRLGRYFGSYNSIADRIATIQTIDLIANGIQLSSYLDYEQLPNVLSTIFPEQLYNLVGLERPIAASVGDLVAWTAGISEFGSISFLSVTEGGEAYAVGGLPAVAYRTFAVYAFCFAMLYLFGGVDLRSNILTITLFLMFFHTAAEGTSSAMYYFWLRIAPQFIISYFLIVKCAGLVAGPNAARLPKISMRQVSDRRE